MTPVDPTNEIRFASQTARLFAVEGGRGRPALPEPIRTRAKALVATYDAASVATSTAFMASGAQPFARGEDLAAITAPALVVPGRDPTHPREVADVFARHLARATVREAEPADYAAAIADFMSALSESA